ncbi:hypothetical protein BDY17DRAFT_319690 [Neohortaea acidophila]|uniref:Phosphoglucomutase n=1 Tax=Neohortaea acidophila TaxID=245834 RepID=A0A6A6Q6U5_9PEZI|nr:uncharacterized protein BDY17DRAFT_319690 [Neohortaea acidophila]KAF2487127.1 hypothetical protein BDY17DRAFT_319690 [Neohortaea acidophila]
MESIDSLSKRWLELDKNETTRKEIADLIAAKDVAALEGRLRHRIAFGTAGLRSSMKAGFAHMNDVTVLLASQGLAQYILNQHAALANRSSEAPKVVIGYDARYNSERFARLAAAAFLAKGFEVLWFGELVHTPMVPFSVSHYRAAAGVMVTASHNPKNDNGYKVYWSNGCQIIPPHDIGIAKEIDAEQSIITWDATLVDSDPRVHRIVREASQAYFSCIRRLVSELPAVDGSLVYTYTPMHGVGLPFMKQAAHIVSQEDGLQIVDAQADSDPEFRTVPFPNPEEKGALDMAKAKADQAGCSLILANDPDADRFAAAERLTSGEWHQFTGNQMGVLLASYVLESHTGDRTQLAMLASTVSSRMLATIAKKEGFHFVETLTGFKWLGNVAQNLREQGLSPVFAYEEAIGYMFPTVVWDKDGIAAAAMFLKACAHWKQQGRTPWQRLQALYEKYGYFEDANTYLISPSPTVTNKAFNDIRMLHRGARPERIGEHKILRWRDLTIGYDSSTPDNQPNLPIDASAQMITCELENVVFTVRGSGTEPKIKIYIEASLASSVAAKALAAEVLGDLLREWFRPEYGLRLAGT